MSEVFQLFECGDVFQFTDPADSYQTWQGLRGPKGDPGEPGPPGSSVELRGPVETTGDLPPSAPSSELWLVGDQAPYHGWFYNGTSWENAGEITVGPQGPPGEDGQDGAAAGFGTPTISVGSGTGTPSATITASGPDTAKVFAFAFDNLKGAQGDPGAAGQDGADGADGVSPEVTITSITGGHTVTITDADHPTGQSFNVMDGSDGAPGQGVPSGGTAGQVLTKDSSTDYDTSWADPEAGGINRNLLDNWYFVGGGTGTYGVFPVNQRGQATYSTNETYTIDRWGLRLESGGSCTVNTSGVTLSGNSGGSSVLSQTYENGGESLLGKTVTFSAMFSAVSGPVQLYICNATGFVYFSTVLATENASVGVSKVTTTIPSALSNSYLNFMIGATNAQISFSLIAAKLEIGDTQTLAHQENGVWVLNEIPNFEEQLIRCNTSQADSGDTYANRVVAYTDQALPAGGSAGQVLTKKTSGTDYDTEWATPEAGGGALYFPSVAMTATTGTIISISNAAITADYVLASVVFSKPAAVTAGGNFSSGAGTFTMTGTCTDATCTAQIVLVKKSN